jgi:hypothetical protein
MAMNITILCDRCHKRVAKASHTRIKWSREPDRRDPTDLCPECRDDLLEHLGILPPTLPGMKPSEMAKNNPARN